MSQPEVFTARTDLTEAQLSAIRVFVRFFASHINPDGTEPIRLAPVMNDSGIDFMTLATLPPSPENAGIANSPSYFRNIDPETLEPDITINKLLGTTIVFNVRNNAPRTVGNNPKANKTFAPKFPSILIPLATVGPYDARLTPPGNYMAASDPRRIAHAGKAWLKVMKDDIYKAQVGLQVDASPLVSTDSHNFDMISFFAWKHIVYVKGFEFVCANIAWFPGIFSAFTSRHADLAMAAGVKPLTFPVGFVASENARMDALYKESVPNEPMGPVYPRPKSAAESIYNTWELTRIAMRNLPYPGFNVKTGLSLNLEEYLLNSFGKITDIDQQRLAEDPLFTTNPIVRQAVLGETAPTPLELATPLAQRAGKAVPYQGVPVYIPGPGKLVQINPDKALAPVGSKVSSTTAPGFRVWKSALGYGLTFDFTPKCFIIAQLGENRRGRKDPTTAFPEDAFASYTQVPLAVPAICAPPKGYVPGADDDEDPEMAAAMIAAMEDQEESDPKRVRRA